MSPWLAAQLVVLAAVVMIFVHRWVATRWLSEYVARHGRLPGRDWITKRDADPAVELWRRRRLIALVPTIGLFALGIALLLAVR